MDDLGNGWRLLLEGQSEPAFAAFRDEAGISDGASDGDLLAKALAEAIVATVNGDDQAAGSALEGALRLAARAEGKGAWQRVALALLATAISQGDWGAAGAAADRVLQLVGDDELDGLARTARSTKWERLSGTRFDDPPIRDDRDPWLRAFRALYRLRQKDLPAGPASAVRAPRETPVEQTPDPDVCARVVEAAATVLGDAWNEPKQCCFPHRDLYPHQWLWDSCFHSIAWASLGDRRGLRELEQLFTGQLESGFLPHMIYASPSPGRGPLTDRSSFTQPPIYVHALTRLAAAGLTPSSELVAAAGRALEYLLTERRARNGLVYVVHPWETGLDDSARWDDWVGIESWDIDALAASDHRLVEDVQFDDSGAARGSSTMVACPASFNALTAWACAEYAAFTGDPSWDAHARELSDAIDALMWNEDEGLWDDIAVVGGGSGSSRIPTVDAILPALVSADADHADRAIDQLIGRFSAPYGRTFVPTDHASFMPDVYWRGPTWPQLEYLLWSAAARRGRVQVATQIVAGATRGVLAARFAEYWNPFTGQGHGGKPQTWATVVAAMAAGEMS